MSESAHTEAASELARVAGTSLEASEVEELGQAPEPSGQPEPSDLSGPSDPSDSPHPSEVAGSEHPSGHADIPDPSGAVAAPSPDYAGERQPEHPAPDVAELQKPVPTTSDPRVDDALSRLAEVDSLPLAEQVEVYADIHRRLAGVLSDPDSQA